MRDVEILQEACLRFGETIDTMLEIWAEDEGREFVVDYFDVSGIDTTEILPSKPHECLNMVDYQLANAEEPLDFWFEMEFRIEQDDTIILILDINI